MWSTIRRWRSYDEKIEGQFLDYRTFAVVNSWSMYINTYDGAIKIVGDRGTQHVVEKTQPFEEIDCSPPAYAVSNALVFCPKDPVKFSSRFADRIQKIPESVDNDTLFLFDSPSNSYRVHSTGCSMLYNDHVITIKDRSSNIILSQRIEPRLVTLNPMYRSMIWTYILVPPETHNDRIPEPLTWIWGFRFMDFDDYVTIVENFRDSNIDSDDSSDSSEDDSQDVLENPQNDKTPKGFDLNLHGDLGYVADDGDLYAMNDKNQVVKIAEFGNAKDKSIKQIKHIMLHDGETKIVAPLNNTMTMIDIDGGKVVRDWSLEHPVSKVCHSSKNSQRSTDTTTFRALNSLGIMTFDPRTQKGIVSANLYGAHSRPFLSCMATTEDGDIVVGSRRGEIRLYEKGVFTVPDKAPRAKNTYPGFGDPILAVDVTKDGYLVLCTCSTYLIVIDTSSINGTNGFKTSMGKDRKEPVRLSLTPYDAEFLRSVKFSKATFDSKGQKIVTSTGKHVVIWNLTYSNGERRWSYEIRDFGEEVVDQDFRCNKNRPVVATSRKLIS